MAALTAADFTAGATFEVPAGDGHVTLTLERVQELPRAAREAGAFRLDFSGPTEPLLPQSIYPFVIEGTAHDIFIVPIARDGQRSHYEAIFN
jgi:hypothetical protein